MGDWKHDRSCIERPGRRRPEIYAHPTGQLLAVLDRAFSTDARMPIVSSAYWSTVHGALAEEVECDAEGLQTMRNLARRMAWLLKCIEAGREAGVEPSRSEREAWTSFVR